MKKIFTCLSLAAVSMMVTAPAIAQVEKQLTDNEKAAIVKVVVPAMFDQVKQISGIDFMALTQPSIEGVVESPLFFPQMSTLRANKLNPISFKPDSMTLDLSSMDITSKLPENMAPMAQIINDLVKNIKFSFAQYTEYNVSVSGRTINASLPKVITVSLPKLDKILTLNFITGKKGIILPYNSIAAELKLEGLLASLGNKLPIKSGNLLSINESLNSKKTIDYNVTIGESLRGISEKVRNVPNYLINVDMTKLATKESLINASLYGIPVSKPDTKLPMGDATVYANLKATTGVPADSIILTSYDKELNVSGYKKLVSTCTVSGENLVLTTMDSIRTPENTTWRANMQRIVKMPASCENMINSLTSSLIASVTQSLKAGNSFDYLTTIDSVIYSSQGKMDTVRVMAINATTTIEAVRMNEQVMTVNIDFNKGQEAKKVMNIQAIAPSNKDVITFKFTPTKYGENPMGTLYVASDFYSVITDNEVIEDVEETKVVPSAGSIYVKNGKGEYIIVNMVGKVIATGIITSDEEYIATPNMPNGIYMISIKGEKERTTVKFVK